MTERTQEQNAVPAIETFRIETPGGQALVNTTTDAEKDLAPRRRGARGCMMTDAERCLREWAEQRAGPGTTHWDGCYESHPACAARAVLRELDALRQIVREYKEGHGAAESGVDSHGIPVDADACRCALCEDARRVLAAASPAEPQPLDLMVALRDFLRRREIQERIARALVRRHGTPPENDDDTWYPGDRWLEEADDLLRLAAAPQRTEGGRTT